MKKAPLFILLLFVLSIEMFSQQDPQFAFNKDNLLFTNPAYAGMTDGICATAISRQQWVGFDGAPKTTLAGIHSKVKLFGINGGIGLTINDDRYEFEKDFQAKLAFSYHKRFGIGILGIGLETGIINKDLQGDWRPPETDEDVFITGDGVRKIVFDLGGGIFYKVGESFYASFSISHINQPEIKYSDVIAASFLTRHYYATAGYNFRLFNSPVEMKPSVFVKFDGTKMQYSGNITALYNKKFSLGVTYRNKDAIIPMIGFELANGLKIGYAYEVSLTKLVTIGKGTHEVFVGYCFDLWGQKSDYKYKSILYL